MPFGGPHTTDGTKYTEDTPYSELPNNVPTSPKSDRTVTFDLGNKDDKPETSETSDLDKVIAANDKALDELVRDINKEHEQQGVGTQDTRVTNPYVGQTSVHDDGMFDDVNLHEIPDSTMPTDTGEQQGWAPNLPDDCKGFFHTAIRRILGDTGVSSFLADTCIKKFQEIYDIDTWNHVVHNAQGYDTLSPQEVIVSKPCQSFFKGVRKDAYHKATAVQANVMDPNHGLILSNLIVIAVLPYRAASLFLKAEKTDRDWSHLAALGIDPLQDDVLKAVHQEYWNNIIEGIQIPAVVEWIGESFQPENSKHINWAETWLTVCSDRGVDTSPIIDAVHTRFEEMEQAEKEPDPTPSRSPTPLPTPDKEPIPKTPPDHDWDSNRRPPVDAGPDPYHGWTWDQRKLAGNTNHLMIPKASDIRPGQTAVGLQCSDLPPPLGPYIRIRVDDGYQYDTRRIPMNGVVGEYGYITIVYLHQRKCPSMRYDQETRTARCIGEGRRIGVPTIPT
ncbi:MAG: hypothetical protein ACRCT2_05265 [Plesiomonas shigelloides]